MEYDIPQNRLSKAINMIKYKLRYSFQCVYYTTLNKSTLLVNRSVNIIVKWAYITYIMIFHIVQSSTYYITQTLHYMLACVQHIQRISTLWCSSMLYISNEQNKIESRKHKNTYIIYDDIIYKICIIIAEWNPDETISIQ